jgi:hypothetical protein
VGAKREAGGYGDRAGARTGRSAGEGRRDMKAEGRRQKAEGRTWQRFQKRAPPPLALPHPVPGRFHLRRRRSPFIQLRRRPQCPDAPHLLRRLPLARPPPLQHAHARGELSRGDGEPRARGARGCCCCLAIRARSTMGKPSPTGSSSASSAWPWSPSWSSSTMPGRRNC